MAAHERGHFAFYSYSTYSDNFGLVSYEYSTYIDESGRVHQVGIYNRKYYCFMTHSFKDEPFSKLEFSQYNPICKGSAGPKKIQEEELADLQALGFVIDKDGNVAFAPENEAVADNSLRLKQLSSSLEDGESMGLEELFSERP